jgi:hypothetical protein
VRVRVLQGFTYDVVGERIDEDGKPLAKETQETPQQEGSDAHDAE